MKNRPEKINSQIQIYMCNLGVQQGINTQQNRKCMKISYERNVFMCTLIVIIQILSKQMIKKLTEIKDQYKT